jgi:hypothetical protein
MRAMDVPQDDGGQDGVRIRAVLVPRGRMPPPDVLDGMTDPVHIPVRQGSTSQDMLSDGRPAPSGTAA